MEKLPKQVYTSEYRAQAVAMIVRDKMSVAEVARRLSMSSKTLANWIKRAKDANLPAASGDAGAARRVVTEEQAELSRLRRENAELRTLARHLKKVSGVLCERVTARCAMIKELRSDYSVRVLCRVLRVSSSGYHAWATRQASQRAKAQARLHVAAQAAHTRTRSTYGAVRLPQGVGERRLRGELGHDQARAARTRTAVRPTEEVLPCGDDRLAARAAGRPQPVGAALHGDAT